MSHNLEAFIGYGVELVLNKSTINVLLQQENTTLEEIYENGGINDFLTNCDTLDKFKIIEDNTSANYEKYYLCIFTIEDNDTLDILLNKINITDNNILTKFNDTLKLLKQENNNIGIISCVFDYFKDPMEHLFELNDE